jgi:hypothetical protein
MHVRYGRLVFVSVVTVTLILAGCTMLDLFGKSPTQLAKDLLDIVFTASATELVYVEPDDSEMSDYASDVVDFIRGFLTFGGTATPTIQVSGVVEYKNYKFYQVSGAPDFVDKVYMINLALTYSDPATKVVATEIPMITIKNVRNRAYFFTVYLDDNEQPTLYPSPTFLSD